MGDKSLARLMGNPQELAVERALAEVRSGRPVILNAEGEQYLIISPEGIDEDIFGVFKSVGSSAPELVLSQPRLRQLGLATDEPGTLSLANMSTAEIHELITRADFHLNGYVPKSAGGAEKSALEVMRLAYLLPAAIVTRLPVVPDGLSFLAQVDAEALAHYRRNVINAPRIVSRAPVPLEDADDTEFVVFRGGEGMRDQVAVIVGKPRPSEPVYVRLHSACLTGDLFGSLKCDCGDQLRGTVKFMSENGGGVLLYLDQEGRGNGIANKIRAYRLQHAGYNTFDADRILGFDSDQRRFEFAAAMLKQLGYYSIKLITNNPVKVLALKEAGLQVVSSHRAKARLTLQNVGYLEAKRDHAGHMIEEDLKL